MTHRPITGTWLDDPAHFRRPSRRWFLQLGFAGGIGLSRPLYEIREQVLNATGQLILSCSCDDGCPSCVGPMAMAKEVALSILDCLKHG